MGNYFKNVWLGVFTVFIGMQITFKHLFAKNVTVQYPDEQYPIPSNARNRLFLDMNACNGCMSCSRACPVNCITVETLRVSPTDPEQEILSDGAKRKLWVPVYDIDFAKCCFCSLCTTVCPTEAVKHTVEFEYSTYNREDLLYHFTTMSPEKIEQKKVMLEEHLAKEKAAKAEAAKKAAEAKAAEPESKPE